MIRYPSILKTHTLQDFTLQDSYTNNRQAFSPKLIPRFSTIVPIFNIKALTLETLD
jgi:hypothetical protein